MLKFYFLLLLFVNQLFSNVLQETINKAQPYSIIKLSKGLYVGNIIIDKPLTLIGMSDDVIISGENNDSVIRIISSDVTLKKLSIQNSGNRLDRLDSAIKISNANNIEINDCKIKNALFGIDASMMNNSKIIHNEISSFLDNEISLKGDALRFFYSNDNLISNNRIISSRDVSFAYSHKNKITKNHTELGRFALLIENSKDNLIEENHFKFNSVGLLLAGVKNTTVTNNIISKSIGAAGIGVVLKGVDNFQFKENIVSYNAKGIYIDAKHNEEGIKRFIEHNEISYNKEAFHFHGALKQNKITDNTIIGNIDDIVKGVRGNFSSKNIVSNNYWDQYAGFDINRDNIGDSSYYAFQYADQLWHYNNKIKFFYAAPVISLLNFLVKVAPFIEPVLLLEDRQPIVELKAK